MKRILITCGLALCSLVQSSAQEEVSRLSFGLSGSADYCQYLGYLNGEFQGVNSLTIFELPYAGWTIGLTSDYKLGEHFSLTTGLRFSEHNTSTGRLTFISADGTDMGTGRIIFHSRFADLPIGIQYNTSKAKRIHLIANATITPGLSLGQWNASNVDNKAEDNGFGATTAKADVPNLNRFSFKGEAYAGVGTSFSSFELQFLLQGRYHFVKQTTGNYYDRRYFTTGAEIRFLYHIYK